MSLLDASGMTGDIWSTGAFATESPLKDLLDSEDFTIEQLLAEDELLQELRGLHPQLLDYLSTEEAVSRLIQYITLDPNAPPPEPKAQPEEQEPPKPTEEQEKPTEPGKWLFQQLEMSSSIPKDKTPENDPDNRTIRFPYMACEIICCELQGVISVLVDGLVPPEGPPPPRNTEDTPPIQPMQPPETKSQDEEDEQQLQQSETRQRILDQLFAVLYDTPPGQLDDHRAGYLEKILSVLFRKRPQAMSEYVNTGGGKGHVTLMKAMVQHLYSHSIMQIVQRLMLPQPPQLLQQQQQQAAADEAAAAAAAENIMLCTSDPEIDDSGVIIEGGEIDDETKILQCTWSETGEALDLLLEPLISPTAAVVANKDAGELPNEEEERQLSLCQNASEVLITIIQNSPLNSPTMLRLTVDPTLEKVVDRASTLREGEIFGPHESSLTSSMNVLESLILQLGGYGSVGTISLMPTVPGEDDDDENAIPPPAPQFADMRTLLLHIPRLLRGLSALLQNDACNSWRSPMQFSKESEPELLLGMSRLRIVRLLESLVLLGETSVDSLLCQSDCLEVCLDLFWKFQWCSMLHQSVANLLVHVFEGANARSEVQEYFLVQCNLLGRLMDSFREVSPGEPGYIVRDNAPLPQFSDQEVVIAIKGMKMDEGMNHGSDVSPRPALRVDSTEEATGDDNADQQPLPVSEDDVEAALEQQAEQRDAAAAEPADAMVGATTGIVDNSVEQVSTVSTEAVRYESRDTSTVGGMLDGAPAQSFRLGYMGHVIIICQALVHACAAENETEEDDELEGELPAPVVSEEDEDEEQPLLEERTGAEDEPIMNGEHSHSSNEDTRENRPISDGNNNDTQEDVEGDDDADDDAGRDENESARGVDSLTEGIAPANPLMLSRIIDDHHLKTRWEDFINTTLASETAIQSTPLGGFNNALHGGDPLHAHRPLGDDDDFDDGGIQPNMPPRGMLGGGDVIDMDDNDLDIAASMMAGLHLGTSGDDSDEDEGNSDDEESGDSGGTYGSAKRNSQGGYVFDDPLGGRKSGLGLALGNLGEYHPDGNSDEGGGGSDEGDADSDAGDGGSDHSSEEDESDRHRLSQGVPVMNLFAGNLGDDEKANEGASGSPFDDPTWSNFANFDDAFAGAEAEAATDGELGFKPKFTDTPEVKPEPFPSSTPSSAVNGEIDEIFGGPGDHADLLIDDATTKDSGDGIAEAVAEPVESPEATDVSADGTGDNP